MSERTSQFTPLTIALSAAVLVHSAIFALIYVFGMPNLLEKDKTVPIVLVSSPNASTSPNKMSKNENADAAREFLNTLNESSSSRTSTKKKQPTPLQNIKAPTPPQPISPESLRTSTSSNAISDFQNIFTKSNASPALQNKRQVSSKESEKLSDYELKLLQTLAKDSLYDAFHPIMARHNKPEVSYKITLKLFPNGAIKNATIAKSSGDKEIDQLAIQAAYRASPFPAPPREDIAVRYQYEIPIIYQDKQ